jgi:hypothetical protein
LTCNFVALRRLIEICASVGWAFAFVEDVFFAFAYGDNFVVVCDEVVIQAFYNEVDGLGNEQNVLSVCECSSYKLFG